MNRELTFEEAVRELENPTPGMMLWAYNYDMNGDDDEWDGITGFLEPDELIGSYGPFVLTGEYDLPDRPGYLPISEPREEILTPNWEVTCEWSARALSEHLFEQYETAPVVSFIQQVTFLTIADPDALQRVIVRISRLGRGRTGL